MGLSTSFPDFFLLVAWQIAVWNVQRVRIAKTQQPPRSLRAPGALRANIQASEVPFRRQSVRSAPTTRTQEQGRRRAQSVLSILNLLRGLRRQTTALARLITHKIRPGLLVLIQMLLVLPVYTKLEQRRQKISPASHVLLEHSPT